MLATGAPVGAVRAPLRPADRADPIPPVVVAVVGVVGFAGAAAVAGDGPAEGGEEAQGLQEGGHAGMLPAGSHADREGSRRSAENARRRPAGVHDLDPQFR